MIYLKGNDSNIRGKCSSSTGKHVSIISFACLILLGAWAHNIECNVLLIDWWKCLHTSLAYGFLTVVVSFAIQLAYNKWGKDVLGNPPPLLCIQCYGQGFCANQLFSNNIMIWTEDLIAMHTSSAG